MRDALAEYYEMQRTSPVAEGSSRPASDRARERIQQNSNGQPRDTDEEVRDISSDEVSVSNYSPSKMSECDADEPDLDDPES